MTNPCDDRELKVHIVFGIHSNDQNVFILYSMKEVI